MLAAPPPAHTGEDRVIRGEGVSPGPPPESDRASPRLAELFPVSASPGGPSPPATSPRIAADPLTPLARGDRSSLAAARIMAAAGGVVDADVSAGSAASLPPLANAVAAAVRRVPGGAVGALALAAALFYIADGAVAEAADAAGPPRRLDPAAAEARADAAEARGVRVAASAAATANSDLALSSRALLSLPTSPSPKGRLNAKS